MKTIGIKLADGSFYPVLQDNTPSEKTLELTTAHNNQTKVMVDLYRSATCSMDDAEYVDSLQIENLNAHPNGEPDISFSISVDEDNQLSAKIIDKETGNTSDTTITLVSRTLEERLVTDEYDITENEDSSSGALAGAVAGAAAAGGLLAAAAALRSKKEEETSEEVTENTDTIEETEMPVDETSVDETEISDDTSFDLPDDTVVSEDETISDEPAISEDDMFTSDESTVSNDETITTEESSELPDMDFDLPDDTDTTVSEDKTESTELPDMDFDMPEDSDMDFDLPDDTETSVEDQPEMPDDFFNTEDDTAMKESTFEDDAPAAAGLNFDGLYDEETKRGESAETESDEVKKKTKVPVIICIICAIICIIATLLILFIIPSKYNLLKKKAAKDSGTTVVVAEEKPAAETEKPAEPEPAVPQAKEDEIVIIEKAEEVVPAQPPVAEKPKNISYKIKWGDTLWDIADTYYKNPWRYKYIARYNGIKNPDHIISGTVIIIPAQ